MTTIVDGTNGVSFPYGATQSTGAGPAFSAYLSSNQSVSNATYTKVQLNTESYDTNSNFDNTTNYRFTPTVAGYYLITGSIRISSTSPSTYVWAIYKNGANYAELNVATSPAQYDARTVTQIISMNGTTDYIELFGYCSGSSAQTFNAGSNETWLSGCLLRGS